MTPAGRRRPGGRSIGLLAVLAAVVVVVVGFLTSGDEPPEAVNAPRPSRPASTTSSPTEATPPPPPLVDVCYDLTTKEALQPTSGDTRPVECGSDHTTATFLVGRLDTVVDGHLLRVDATRVQERLADTCRTRLPQFLGGTSRDLALTMFTTVWFSPTVEQSEAGADWFRCDVAALSRDGRLAELPDRSLRDALDKPALASQFGRCADGPPGRRATARVICSTSHSWRAIDTLALDGRAYPGASAVRKAGEGWCSDQADARTSAVAFRYAWEWPTRQQWADGQHYGYCWVPD